MRIWFGLVELNWRIVPTICENIFLSQLRSIYIFKSFGQSYEAVVIVKKCVVSFCIVQKVVQKMFI